MNALDLDRLTYLHWLAESRGDHLAAVLLAQRIKRASQAVLAPPAPHPPLTESELRWLHGDQ